VLIQPAWSANTPAPEISVAAQVESRRAESPPALLLGESRELRDVRDRLPQIARVERTTLVLGPTGTGKDLVAR